MGSVIEHVVWRPVMEEELEMVMKWRMTPEITKYMYTDPVLTLELQKEWYEKNKKDECNHTFMIEVNGVPSGILTISDIDRRNRRCSWGYYVAVKAVRSLELSMMLEWNVYDYAFERLKLHKVVGEIFAENKAVVRIHQMCGSVIEGRYKDHILKNGRYYDVISLAITEDMWREEKKKRIYKKADIWRN